MVWMRSLIHVTPRHEHTRTFRAGQIAQYRRNRLARTIPLADKITGKRPS